MTTLKLLVSLDSQTALQELKSRERMRQSAQARKKRRTVMRRDWYYLICVGIMLVAAITYVMQPVKIDRKVVVRQVNQQGESTVGVITYTSKNDLPKPHAYEVDYGLWPVGVYSGKKLKQMEAKSQPEILAKVALEKKVINKNINNTMTDKEKVKIIHDWIVCNAAYDATKNAPLISYTAFGVIYKHKAVCSGYSEAFADYMSLLRIPCVIIEGTAVNNIGESGTHAWNAVYLDGRWLYVDVTWDDPWPDAPGKVSHTFFLVPKSAISKSHNWNGSEERSREQLELKRIVKEK